MSSNKYITEEPWLFAEITKPTEDEVDSYYQNTGEIKVSDSSPNAPRKFKRAKILHTFNEDKYPIGSSWIMGEVPGMIVNYFGEKLIMIQQKDLYARIN